MDLALLPQGYDAVVRKVMHALFGGISRSVVILLAVAVVIVAAPAIASCFDDRGLPGSPMVFLVLAVVAAASGFALFFTMTPRRARSHALRQLGRDLNLPYFAPAARAPGPERAPFVPTAFRSVDRPRRYRGTSWPRSLLVFAALMVDRRRRADPLALCAATTTMLSAPQPLIGPRHFSVDERAVLDEVRFESGAFNRIWEVRTNDHLLSSTIVDERLMSWLLEREPDVSFELDGPWAMTVSRGTDAAVPGDLVAALDDFLEHLPRVVIAELGRGY